MDPLILESQKSPEFPKLNLLQIVQGVPELWSDKQTNRQTEITTIYIDDVLVD